jgi:hypothetical protein
MMMNVLGYDGTYNKMKKKVGETFEERKARCRGKLRAR